MSAHGNPLAFPATEAHGLNSGDPGMGLRDYAAIHADVTWSAACEAFEIKFGRRPTLEEHAAYVAKIRYLMADAMLAERVGEARS